MKDKYRKSLYIVMLIFAALQIYVVREWLVAFILFSLAFAVIAPIILLGYGIQKLWMVLVRKYY